MRLLCHVVPLIMNFLFSFCEEHFPSFFKFSQETNVRCNVPLTCEYDRSN